MNKALYFVFFAAVLLWANSSSDPLRVYVYQIPPSLLALDNEALPYGHTMYFTEHYLRDLFSRPLIAHPFLSLLPPLLPLLPFLPPLSAAFTLYTPVEDPASADFFFLPHEATRVYSKCLDGNKGPDLCKAAAARHLELILDHVQKEYPFWNRSGGRDHLIAFAWDQASEVLGWNSKIRQRVMPAIHLTHLGTILSSPSFNTFKDVVIPPYLSPAPLLEARQRLLPPQRTSKEETRKHLALFRGTVHNDTAYSQGVRQRLMQLSALPGSKIAAFDSHNPHYLEEMTTSSFCLCPSGWSLWTARLFESIVMECIPVIYADGIELPFEDLLDYKRFAVKIRHADVDRTAEIISAISEKDRQRMRRELGVAFHYLLYNDRAFEYIVKVLRNKRTPRGRVGLEAFP